MPATIDQDLVPNAIVTFHAAKEAGKTEEETWAAVVEGIRFDVLRLAITTLALGEITSGDDPADMRKRCIDELRELQGLHEAEADPALF